MFSGVKANISPFRAGMSAWQKRSFFSVDHSPGSAWPGEMNFTASKGDVSPIRDVSFALYSRGSIYCTPFPANCFVISAAILSTTSAVTGVSPFFTPMSVIVA